FHMSGRRQSVTAQIQRTARRFSAALVPQLTKLEILPILDKIRGVEIRITDFSKYATAQQQYILHNSVQFAPIEFDIFSLEDGRPILSVSLFPEEIVVNEGQKRIIAISLNEDDAIGTHIAHMKHPVSGMKVYEINENSTEEFGIRSCSEDSGEYRLKGVEEGFASIFFSCGCSYTKSKWEMKKLVRTVATISPKKSFFSENAMTASWVSDVDNETRLIALSAAIVQLIREGYPAVLNIIKEFHVRHG
ncbi:hypothetical protein PMAYCL1PPCAC_18478, partial [Pristionchus mayeri]